MNKGYSFDSKCIDSLKGIGILGVVLVHCRIDTSNNIISNIVDNGARGVQLLFDINAFLIFNSLSKIDLNKKNILNWWKNKFLRLIPLYWFFTIVHLLVFGIGERYFLGPLPKVSFLNIVCNLFFLHGFNPYYINSINANWFMADLAMFYIIAPFLYKIINSLEKAIYSIVITTIGGYILMHFALNINVISVEGIWQDYVKIISFPAELPIMLLGILAYYIYWAIKDKVENKRLFSYIIVFFSLFCMLSYIAEKNYFILFNNIYSFGILFTLIVISQLVYPMSIIRNVVFEILGKHSYGIYLSHIIVLKYVNIMLGDIDLKKSIVRFILVIFISLGVANISEKTFDYMIGIFEKCLLH
jgi:peptidoglycan/LPS O-acetylase OafA/YrhL